MMIGNYFSRLDAMIFEMAKKERVHHHLELSLFIVMHAGTWVKMLMDYQRSNPDGQKIAVVHYGDRMHHTYEGVTVYRSVDIPEDEFRIGIIKKY